MSPGTMSKRDSKMKSNVNFFLIIYQTTRKEAEYWENRSWYNLVDGFETCKGDD